MSPNEHSDCDCHHEHDQTAGRRVHRRAVLAGAGTAAAASVAGCLSGDGGATPAAVAISDAASCDECGMVISKHPGPNGEIYWADTGPESHDAPFRFDSLKKCFFPHYFEGDDEGRELSAAFVTDYSAVDYTVTTEGGESYISSHTGVDAFAPAKSLQYVVESDVKGAMGPDFLPFGDEGDADAFAAEYGGSVVRFEDVTPALTGQ